MKKRLLCLSALFLGVQIFSPSASADSSLKSFLDCYDAALKRAVTVATQQEAIVQAQDNYKQLIGSVLPNVTGGGSYGYQESTTNSSPLVAQAYNGWMTSTRLTVTQPLFQGFKEFAGLRQATTLIKASEFDKKQAATQLYQDTAASFFSVAAYEHDIEDVNDELNFYDKRIKELKQFYAIGRSQLTDELSTESQAAALRAQLKQIKGALRAQRAVLAFLTGFDTEVKIARPPVGEVPSRPLKDYLDQLQTRPDVQADSARSRSAVESITIARAGWLPTLGFQGDYYIQRTGPIGNNWDLMLSLSVPIFDWGYVRAQVNQAGSKRVQADLQVTQTQRLAEQQIRQFFESYLGDRDQYEGYKEATALAEKAFKAELLDYKRGLVTNLDVLQALITFQESKRSQDKASYSMMQDLEDVESAGGFRPKLASASSQ